MHEAHGAFLGGRRLDLRSSLDTAVRIAVDIVEAQTGILVELLYTYSFKDSRERCRVIES